MNRSYLLRRFETTILSLMIMFAFIPILGQDAYAAANNPKSPEIITAQVNGNTVILRWNKVKNTKKYKVYVQTGADSWKYWKSVRKTKVNKKKNSDKLKYKLKKSGKKYKVYKQKNPYKLITKTRVRNFTYKGEYGTTYRFVVKAMKGKKVDRYSTTKVVTTVPRMKTPRLQSNDSARALPGTEVNVKGKIRVGGAYPRQCWIK